MLQNEKTTQLFEAYALHQVGEIGPLSEEIGSLEKVRKGSSKKLFEKIES